MSESEKEKDVSCFKVDGVVAEMVIEVEENQKAGLDDFRDIPSDKQGEDHETSDEVKECAEFETNKKEDKENFIDISDSSEIENMKEDKKRDKTSALPSKRKKKNNLTVSDTENKDTDVHRYPGRKRLANKRYITEYIITSKNDKSESDIAKDTSKGKKRKPEANSQDVNDIEADSNDKLLNNSGQNSQESNLSEIGSISAEESSDVMNVSHPEKVDFGSKLGSKKVKIEPDEIASKQDVLRKLPFRKNKNAPDVPDLQPKVYLYNGVGQGMGDKLGDIPDLGDRIRAAKSVRSLYRVLFFQWPTNGQDLIRQILEFNGFPFEKSSYEFNKRKSLMKIMLDVTISNVCEILDLKKGDKQTMIDNILNFLMKPYKKIDPTLEPSLQPVVVLERLNLDGKYLDQVSKSFKPRKNERITKGNVTSTKSKEKVVESTTPARETRRSFSKAKLVVKNASKNSPKEDLKVNKSRLSTPKLTVRSASKLVSPEKTTSKAKDVKPKTGKDAKQAPIISNNSESEEKSEVFVKSAEVKPVQLQLKKKKFKKKVKSSMKKSTALRKLEKPLVAEAKMKSLHDESRKKLDDTDIKTSFESEHDFANDVEMEDASEVQEPPSIVENKIKKKTGTESKKVTIATKVSTVTLSDSSETESAEETKLVTSQRQFAKSKQTVTPLGIFPKIRECIQKANFSALQRLHILLFGASDKPENLKANILSFGGFLFLEGSDEWKQKHFLLSLLAQNNLREYLNLLCIQYSDDDQPTMINKLMKFLAAPSEDTSRNIGQPKETVVSSPETILKSPDSLPAKGKIEIKKKIKKKDEKKPPGPRRRKVLMSEEEARRLEASFAREQRALARDSKAPPSIVRNQTIGTMPSTMNISNPVILQNTVDTTKVQPQIKKIVADPNQLNALLQTVYKRRALKAAGAVVSTPNKGERTKLGEIDNIKFLIVTANIADLEILHRLIFMMEASKSRVRKNILDFDGFGFNEDSEKYIERMEFLYSLGYNVSNRISFLLGLCTLQSEIPLQDLNELIMYFLMSPCRTKQVVPITQMPAVPTLGTSEQNQMLKASTPSLISPRKVQTSLKSFTREISSKSTSMLKSNRQKARKSFPSPLKYSPVKKKVLLPPSSHLPIVGAVLNKQALNKSSMTLLNAIPAVPSYSFANPPTNALLNPSSNFSVLNATKPSNINTFTKIPVSPGPKVQMVNKTSRVAVSDTATKISPNTIASVSGNPVILSQVPNQIVIPSQNVVQAPLLQGSSAVVMKSSAAFPSPPQEFLVQQQTPDGHQKTFKLIRLPANHPLASAVPKPIQQTITSPTNQSQVILTTGQPGYALMKDNPGLLSAVQKLQQTNFQNAPNVKSSSPVAEIPVSNIPVTNLDESVSPDKDKPTGISANDDDDEEDDSEMLSSLQDETPSDSKLFESIHEVILSSNFEDITLRNVIERVSAQFAAHDLTDRHNYMKECVKKIIMGT